MRRKSSLVGRILSPLMALAGAGVVGCEEKNLNNNQESQESFLDLHIKSKVADSQFEISAIRSFDHVRQMWVRDKGEGVTYTVTDFEPFTYGFGGYDSITTEKAGTYWVPSDRQLEIFYWEAMNEMVTEDGKIQERLFPHASNVLSYEVYRKAPEPLGWMALGIEKPE